MNLTLMSPAKGNFIFSYITKGIINNIDNKANIKLISLPINNYNFFEDNESLLKLLNLEYSKLNYHESILLHLALPNNFLGNHIFQKAYGLTCFEHILSKEEIDKCNQLDKIFVLTEADKNELIKSGVTKPVIYLPIAIDTNNFYPLTNKLNFENKFTFLSFGDFSFTSGFDLTVKAYLECFASNQNTQLILVWTNSSVESIAQFIQTQREQVRIKGGNIFILKGDFYYNDLRIIYSSSNVLLAPIRKTLFPLELFQSVACGTPIITTGVYGSLLSNYAGEFVKYYIPPILKIPNTNYSIKYYECDYEHLKFIMLNVYNNYENYKKKISAAIDFIRLNYKWEIFINRFLHEIKE